MVYVSKVHLKYLVPATLCPLPTSSYYVITTKLLMPVISDRQCLIDAATQHALWLCARYYHQCKNLRLSLNSSFDSSVDSDNSSNDGTSSTSTSTTSSSSSTNNNNNNNTGDSNGSNNSSPFNLSSAAECDHTLQSLHHSYFQSMHCIQHFCHEPWHSHWSCDRTLCI